MNRIPIVYYHSVAPSRNEQWYKNALTLELVHFEGFLRYLTKSGYVFLDLDEYFQHRENPQFNKRAISLQFDDGYLDNYVFVYPLLKKYGAKATIFVNPEYVPREELLRPTLEDVWSGHVQMHELEHQGFINWSEMRLMESTGHIEIQSHTLTHAKYNFNDHLIDVHRPGANYLNTVGNRFPDHKPYYVGNPNFAALLPFGTPLFEEKSAFLVQRVWINEAFEADCVEALEKSNWAMARKEELLSKIRPIYEAYKAKDGLIIRRETEEEFEMRIQMELLNSREIIENRLSKEVRYCCWPHGNYNDHAHARAVQAGYKASTVVLNYHEKNDAPDRFDRIGHGPLKNSVLLTRWRIIYKVSLYRGHRVAEIIQHIFLFLRYGSRKIERSHSQK